MDPTELEKRLIELEIKMGFSEDLLDGLNQTIYRQQQRIEALQGLVHALRQQIATHQPGETRTLSEELPPHY